MGILILLLILEEKLSMFLSFTIILAVSLLYLTFIMLKYVFSISNLLRNFIMKECCILLAVFSISIELIMQFFSFILLVWHLTFINLRILNYQSITGINLSWSHHIVILIYFWIWFANIVEKFCNSLKFLIYSFLVVSLTGFGNRIIQALQNELKSVPFT